MGSVFELEATHVEGLRVDVVVDGDRESQAKVTRAHVLASQKGLGGLEPRSCVVVVVGQDIDRFRPHAGAESVAARAAALGAWETELHVAGDWTAVVVASHGHAGARGRGDIGRVEHRRRGSVESAGRRPAIGWRVLRYHGAGKRERRRAPTRDTCHLNARTGRGAAVRGALTRHRARRRAARGHRVAEGCDAGHRQERAAPEAQEDRVGMETKTKPPPSHVERTSSPVARGLPPGPDKTEPSSALNSEP